MAGWAESDWIFSGFLDSEAHSEDEQKGGAERGSSEPKRITFFSPTVCFAVKLSECKPVKIQQQQESWTVQRYCKRKHRIKKKEGER
jgi:hypothetical protein